MILDNFLMFTGQSNGTTTGISLGPNTDRPTTGVQASTNIIDLHILAPPGVPVLASGQGARDIGIGDNPAMKILVVVTTALTGSATGIAVSLQGSPDNGSGAPLGFSTWYTSPTYTIPGQAVAGSRLLDMDMPRPPQGLPVPRFLQLSFNSTGGTTTAGALEGCIVLDRHDQMYNASANNVLGGYPPGITIPN